MKIYPRFGCWFLKYTNIKAITLYPLIFFRDEFTHYLTTDPMVLKHEAIHIAQVRRIGWLKFYLTYPFKHKEYEEEAYGNQHLPLEPWEAEIYLPGDK
jgi:hypothetical protein